MSGVIAGVAVRAADRAKALGAEQALEILRQKLEQAPRLRVLFGPRRQDRHRSPQDRRSSLATECQAASYCCHHLGYA